jgi:hypothetical protein
VPFAERQALIAELEGVRHSRLVCYFLADRETHPPGVPGFAANLGSEPQIHLLDLLRSMGKSPAVDLFLYTRGGATDAVWPFVSVLREYCDKLTVIVPFRAHSGGTLIALGADEIIMTEGAELSPIDPTTGNQFNPADPANPAGRFGISVEDVTSYFALANERAGLSQEVSKLDVFKELTSKVHPLALGNVERVYRQIRRLATALLTTHLEEEPNRARIDDIIKAFTEQFYSHVHAINRKEALKLLGDWVKTPTKDEEPLILRLFNAYADTLSLREKFSVPNYMGDQPRRDLRVNGGFLETRESSFVYTTDSVVIQRPNLPPNVQVQVPAGGQIPLVPWATRSYEFAPQASSWRRNTDGT